MLDGINALLSAFGSIWSAVFSAPLYGQLTLGYFSIAVAMLLGLYRWYQSRGGKGGS